MNSLTTGQLCKLLVYFSKDYPDCTIRTIRLHDGYVAISYVDKDGACRRAQYSFKISLEFENMAFYI